MRSSPSRRMPNVENPISDLILPGAILSLMLGMGLTLTPPDFRRIAEAPTATILGTVLQLIVIPATGVGIATWFELPPLLAAGLVLIAACPGGMFSNIFVHLARGNTALSITLTTASTMVTLLTLPLWVRLILSQTGEAGANIEMPFLDTALELGGLTILPLAVGMMIRSRYPASASLESRLTRVAAITIIVAMVLDYQEKELPITEFQQTVLPALELALAAIFVGLAIPRLFRVSATDTAVIAVELVSKNGLLALVIAHRSLGLEATLPIIAYAMFQMPIAALILTGWRLTRNPAAVRDRPPAVKPPSVEPTPASWS